MDGAPGIWFRGSGLFGACGGWCDGKWECSEGAGGAGGRDVRAVVEEKRVAIAIGALCRCGAYCGLRIEKRDGELLGCLPDKILGSCDVGGGFGRQEAWIDKCSRVDVARGCERESQRAAGGYVRGADEHGRVKSEAGHVLNEDDLFACGLERADGGGESAPIEAEIGLGGGDEPGRVEK